MAANRVVKSPGYSKQSPSGNSKQTHRPSLTEISGMTRPTLQQHLKSAYEQLDKQSVSTPPMASPIEDGVSLTSDVLAKLLDTKLTEHLSNFTTTFTSTMKKELSEFCEGKIQEITEEQNKDLEERVQELELSENKDYQELADKIEKLEKENKELKNITAEMKKCTSGRQQSPESLSQEREKAEEMVNKQVNKQFGKEVKKFESVFTNLREENSIMRKAIAQQQQFIESLDHTNRAKDLIITGVPEDECLSDGNQNAYTEQQKCEMIFRKIEQDATIENIQRLGTRQGDRSRPMKVTVLTSAQRNAIIGDAKKLKNRQNFNDIFNKIFIKKDQHPLIRQEWKRLYETKKRESENPENFGLTVEIDRKNRTVLVNGRVVDSFQNFH